MPAMDPVTGIANVISGIIDKFPSGDAKIQAQTQLSEMVITGQIQQLVAQTGVISAEAASSNKLTSSWRPMLMYTFMAIIANNYILAPYLQAMFHFGLQLQIPPDMWELLKLGVGGYVVGRSVEKATTALTGSGVGGAIANVFKGN
jgi:hypothetical protein